jgi:hypothetical protein
MGEFMALYYDEYAEFIRTLKDGCGDEAES